MFRDLGRPLGIFEMFQDFSKLLEDLSQSVPRADPRPPVSIQNTSMSNQSCSLVILCLKIAAKLEHKRFASRARTLLNTREPQRGLTRYPSWAPKALVTMIRVD